MRNVIVCLWHKPGSDYSKSLRALEAELGELSTIIGCDNLEAVPAPTQVNDSPENLLQNFDCPAADLGIDVSGESDFVVAVALLFEQGKGGRLEAYSEGIVKRAKKSELELHAVLSSDKGFGLWYRAPCRPNTESHSQQQSEA